MRKEIQKIEKGKGALAGRSWPSSPAPAPAPRPRARTAALRRRGTPAAFGCRVARMRRLGRALLGHQVRPTAPAFTPTAICTSQLFLSRSLAHALRAQGTAVAIGAPSSASAVLPQRVSHSSVRPSPSSALASPLRNTPPSVW